MKKLISAILLLCCFAALGAFLYLRANVNSPQPLQPQSVQQSTVPPATDEVQEKPVSPDNNGLDEPETADTPEAAGSTVSVSEPVTPEESAPDYLSSYAPVFDSYRLWLSGFEPTMGGDTERGDYYLDVGETGVSYLCRYVDTLGYALVDMDLNGIPELLIGSDTEHQEKYIFDMFTLVDGVPQRVLVSSERVSYMLYPDNQILHRGSGGAAYNFMGVYSYSGTEIVMTSGVVNAGDDQYYEIVGESGSIFEERLPGDTPITREEYFARTDAMEASAIPLSLQPFEELELVLEVGTENNISNVSGTTESIPAQAPAQAHASETPFDIARRYIDHPLDELTAEIGQPVSSIYSPSCLIAGAQDGQLQYDGFWIYTVKDGDMETVKDVLEGQA